MKLVPHAASESEIRLLLSSAMLQTGLRVSSCNAGSRDGKSGDASGPLHRVSGLAADEVSSSRDITSLGPRKATPKLQVRGRFMSNWIRCKKSSLEKNMPSNQRKVGAYARGHHFFIDTNHMPMVYG